MKSESVDTFVIIGWLTLTLERLKFSVLGIAANESASQPPGDAKP